VARKAEAVSNKPRHEIFRDESAEAIIAFLRSATLKGCAATGGSANKGLKIVVRTRAVAHLRRGIHPQGDRPVSSAVNAKELELGHSMNARHSQSR
jgi:hypothetical protein